MANTNMDLNKESKHDGPQLEFTLPISEVMEVLQVGDKGKITIPAEVTQIENGMISFRKAGKASTDSNWKEFSMEELRETLPKKE